MAKKMYIRRELNDGGFLDRLIPSDDDIQKILAEVATNSPMKLPETMIQIQFAKLMAKQFEKLMDMWGKAADELDHKLSE